ncbi:MAG: hypothetical protein QOH60_3882 [Mycobacterium sp.]|jgi:prolipoprotein diacylglyceryl transferase|nr:hypothetical protein [Mycobacterium sp.]
MTRLLASFPSPPQGVWHVHIPVLDWNFPVRAYALCIIAGIIAALLIGDRRWVARGGEKGVIYDIALWAVPFGLIGGRLYHVITDWPKYFGPEGAGFLASLRIWDGGLGIWGAVALGGVGAWIGCRFRGIPLPAFGDAIAPGIVLAQAIGRLGNYFNQELYGRPTSLPWGLEIYERRDAAGNIGLMDGVSTGQLAEPHPVHPTFLYELLWNVLVFVLLIYADKLFKLGHGRLFALYVALYCVGRFLIELRALGLRADEATLISGIRINSFTSTFVFIGAVVYIVLAPKGREDPKTLAGKPRAPDSGESEAEEPDEPKEALGEKDSELVAWAKELVAAGSTSGVVAGVAAAAADDDEAVGDSAAETDREADESGSADKSSESAEDSPEPGSEEEAKDEPVESAAADDDVADDAGDEPGEAEAEGAADESTEDTKDAEDADDEAGEAEPEAAAGEVTKDADDEPGDEPVEAEAEVAADESTEDTEDADDEAGEAEPEAAADEDTEDAKEDPKDEPAEAESDDGAAEDAEPADEHDGPVEQSAAESTTAVELGAKSESERSQRRRRFPRLRGRFR